MNQTVTIPLNPHSWKRFDCAQRNMLRLFRGARHRNLRRLKYWCREVNKWADKLIS